jgi:hypothetical protein
MCIEQIAQRRSNSAKNQFQRKRLIADLLYEIGKQHSLVGCLYAFELVYDDDRRF